MNNTRLELSVGIFLVIGFACFVWLALQLGEVSLLSGSRTYEIYADFDNISGVQTGSDVQVAGVRVGKVSDIILSSDELARATLQLDNALQVPVDSVASVKSQGIIGDKYIQITLGGDEDVYAPGTVLLDTESSVDLESLISKFAFGSVE